MIQSWLNSMKYLKKIFSVPLPIRKTFPLIWLLPFLMLIAADLAGKKVITNSLRFHLSPSQLHANQPLSAVARTTLLDRKTKLDILGENGRFIKLRLVFNDRFAFSIGPNNSIFSFFVSFFAIIFLFFYRAHNPFLGHPIAWLAIFSGAIGNLIDKMFVKSLSTGEWMLSLLPVKGHVTGVVDFIECIWFGFAGLRDTYIFSFLAWETWPSFNLADSLVSTGIVLLLFTMKLRE